ncbi:Nephrocystin-3 [Folsomia candida]|uniref:Nephrocystin-3 n=2 Tax=Folsomia candida TaxID=158441 RepID=A0A226ENJ5_FOLCA|nr:Nephrocystin-3 [Folsomia candida]
MSELRVPQIVKILLEDDTLLQDWVVFAEILEAPSHRITSLRKQRNLSILTYHELLRELLLDWSSRLGKVATISLLVNLLKENHFVQSSEKLEDLQTISGNNCISSSFVNQNAINWDKQVLFGVQHPVRSFVGREKELKELDDLLTDGISPLAVISGLGGMGKSELVKKFVMITSPERIRVANWVNGDAFETLISSIEEFAKFLHLPITDPWTKKVLSPIALLENIVTLVKPHVESTSGFWLFIIDNVDNVYQEIELIVKLLLPFRQCFIIITSRRRDIFLGESEFIGLQELGDADAVKFVNKSIRIPQLDDDVKKLCKVLQNFPLALSQAVAFIKQQQRISLQGEGYRISHYLAEYNTKGKQLLSQKLQLSDYENTTLIALNVTIEKMRKDHGRCGNIAYYLLELVSLLNPDGITVKHLENLLLQILPVDLYQAIKQDNEMTPVVQLLVIYSLVKVNNFVVTIHRMVQKVTRVRTQEEENGVPPVQLNTRETKILNDLLIHVNPKVNKNTKSEMIHILSIMYHTGKYVYLVRTYSTIPNKVYNQLVILSMFREGYEFAVKFFTLLQNTMGEHSFDTLAMQHTIARSLEHVGEWDKSSQTYEQVYHKMVKYLGKRHEETLVAGSNFSFLLWSLDKFEESFALAKLIHKERCKIYEPGNENIITSNKGMAMGLQSLGRHDEARSLYEDVLKWEISVKGEFSPRAVATRHNLAYGQFLQGNYVGSRKQFETIVKEQGEVMGEMHLSTATSKYWLALNLSELGEQEEALNLMEEVVKVREKGLGDKHPYTVKAVDAIAKIKAKLCEEIELNNNN